VYVGVIVSVRVSVYVGVIVSVNDGVGDIKTPKISYIISISLVMTSDEFSTK
jgi:hypothetical protein